MLVLCVLTILTLTASLEGSVHDKLLVMHEHLQKNSVLQQQLTISMMVVGAVMIGFIWPSDFLW